LGVNYATLGEFMTAFNYRTIHWSSEERKKRAKEFVMDHYLVQFNEETILPKQLKTVASLVWLYCKNDER
jgi:hypothetical protein